MREWIDANREKPTTFALQNLMLENGDVIRGWWTGTSWDGLKYKYGFQVIKFKKCGE